MKDPHDADKRAKEQQQASKICLESWVWVGLWQIAKHNRAFFLLFTVVVTTRTVVVFKYSARSYSADWLSIRAVSLAQANDEY